MYVMFISFHDHCAALLSLLCTEQKPGVDFEPSDYRALSAGKAKYLSLRSYMLFQSVFQLDAFIGFFWKHFCWLTRNTNQLDNFCPKCKLLDFNYLHVEPLCKSSCKHIALYAMVSTVNATVVIRHVISQRSQSSVEIED